MTSIHPNSFPVRRRKSAFSLIELLVAIGVSSVMMLLIARIVSETQQAVSRGVELGEVIALSRTISGQMQADADAMFGPHGIGPGERGPTVSGEDANFTFKPGDNPSLPDLKDGVNRSPDVETGGVLVIVKHAFANQPFEPTELIVDAAGAPVTERLILSDQLSFIRERQDEGALTPASELTYMTATDLRAAPFERVWYGHLSKTNPDGTFNPPVTPASGPSFRNGEAEPLLWLLGRQATLLFGEPENAEQASTSSGIRDPQFIPPVHAEGIAPDAEVVGFSAADSPGMPAALLNPPGFSNPLLQFGLTDSAFYGLSEPSTGYSRPGTNDGNTHRIHTNGTVVGGWEGNYVTPANLNAVAANSSDDRLWSNLDFQPYRELALGQMAFLTTSGGSDGLRLMANPYPDNDDLEPWQIAQAHPILAEGCSDFVVEFAADTDGDGEVDTVTAQESENVYGTGDTRAEGEIKWYTDDFLFNSRGSTATAAPRAFDDTSPLTFPLPGIPASTGFASDYPSDANQQAYRDQVFQEVLPAALGPGSEGTFGFVWRHDAFDPSSDPGANDEFYCNWPYLLRIRYRLHDGAGRLAGPDSVQGIWFEQILRVDRPYP